MTIRTRSTDIEHNFHWILDILEWYSTVLNNSQVWIDDFFYLSPLSVEIDDFLTISNFSTTKLHSFPTATRFRWVYRWHFSIFDRNQYQKNQRRHIWFEEFRWITQGNVYGVPAFDNAPECVYHESRTTICQCV